MQLSSQFDVFNRPGEVKGQLPMFMTVAEIDSGYDVNPQETVTSDWRDADRSGGSIDDAVWARKLKEASDYQMVKSVRRKGIQKPVGLYTAPEGESSMIGNGYHRLAAQRFAESQGKNKHDLVPVVHGTSLHDSIEQGDDTERGYRFS